jgi:SAM-dependent methyltransferase
MSSLLDYLRNPLLDEMDVDGVNRLTLHKKILNQKAMLKEVFAEFHHLFKKANLKYLSGGGLEVELGAGIAPMRDSYPEVLATDIVPSDNLDLVINAEQMEFADNSIRVLYGQNCFHHFPNPRAFFKEAERVLVTGGGIILLEPYYGPLATFMYKRLFKTEGFDKLFLDWETPLTGPMNGANQALSYMVFIRDREKFTKEFPSLKIVHHYLVGNYLKYLLSGGLNFKKLCPDILIKPVGLFETIISPLNRIFALHHTIVIRKQ